MRWGIAAKSMARCDAHHEGCRSPSIDRDTPNMPLARPGPPDVVVMEHDRTGGRSREYLQHPRQGRLCSHGAGAGSEGDLERSVDPHGELRASS